MKLWLSMLLLLAVHYCTAQEPFDDGKNIHNRDIFNGKASKLLPHNYSYMEPVVIENYEFSDFTSYCEGCRGGSIYCYLYKSTMSQNELYELYEQLKAQYTDARLQILRDEFQEKSDNSAFFYEFRLRDEVYSNEKGVVDVADSSVIGMLLPNYACFYYTLHNGVASKILFDYQGNIESLDTFRKLALQIISSYQLN